MTLASARQAWFNLKIICTKYVLKPNFDPKIAREIFTNSGIKKSSLKTLGDLTIEPSSQLRKTCSGLTKKLLSL